MGSALNRSAITCVQSAVESIFSGIDWSSLVGSFLGLLIPGLITVAGSYFLYQKRKTDQREKLKSALKAEIKQMDSLNRLTNELTNLRRHPPSDPIPPSKVPPPGVFPTDVYDNNAANLGILDEDLQDSIVSFYAEIKKQKAIIHGIRGDDNIPDADHKELYETIPDLNDQRNQLLSTLESNS